MSCEKPNKLAQISQKMDNSQSYQEWEYYNEQAEEICLKISECAKKCGNDACWGLQNFDEINTQWQEDEMDNRIRDTLPDDEYY